MNEQSKQFLLDIIAALKNVHLNLDRQNEQSTHGQLLFVVHVSRDTIGRIIDYYRTLEGDIYGGDQS